MKVSRDLGISYGIVRSRRTTADIVVERDGRVIVRAPAELPDEHIEDFIQSKRYWIYKTLAEWRDLNATRSCASIATARDSSTLDAPIGFPSSQTRMRRCC